MIGKKVLPSQDRHGDEKKSKTTSTKKLAKSTRKAAKQSRSERIKNLINYIVNPESEEQNEKCIAVQAFNMPHNCNISEAINSRDSARSAASFIGKEYVAVAQEHYPEGGPVKEPFSHWVLSWNPDERLSQDQIFEAGRRFLTKIGYDLDQHQAVLAIHGDTKHQHLHIAVNRVGIDGILCSEGYNRKYKEASQKAVTEICQEMGFQQVEGSLYEYDHDKREAVKKPHRQRLDTLSASAKDWERRHPGEKSQERLLKEAAKEVLATLHLGMGEQAVFAAFAEKNIFIEHAKSGYTFRFGEDGIHFAASKLANELTSTGLKSFLDKQSDASAFVLSEDGLKSVLTEIRDHFGKAKGKWSQFHSLLAEKGILADHNGRHDIKFTLTNGQEFLASQLGEKNSRKEWHSLIGTTMRSRPKNMELPLVSNVEPPAEQPVPQVETETISKAEALHIKANAETPQVAEAPKTSTTDTQKQAVEKMVRIRIEEIRVIRLAHARIQLGIVKRTGRDLPAERKILEAAKSCKMAPLNKQNFDTPEEAAMYAIAMLMHGFGEALAAIGKLIEDFFDFLAALFPQKDLDLLNDYFSSGNRNRHNKKMKEIQKLANSKGIVLPIDIFEIHKDAALRASKQTAQTADPARLSKMIAVRLRITDKSPEETLSILMIGGTPSEIAKKATNYAFNRTDSNYYNLKQKYSQKFKEVEKNHGKYVPQEQSNQRISHQSQAFNRHSVTTNQSDS